MARQSTTPVTFNRSSRPETAVTMTSGRAGVVVPVGYFPVLRGDSVSGKVGIDIELAEMPRPLKNAVLARMQAWFVPKSAHPQFAGMDEFLHSYMGKVIKTLGAADRTPPPFFTELNGANVTTAAASDFFKALGIHVPTGAVINTDLIDAFTLIYNFRLAAHSSRLARRQYASENLANSVALPRAFWPSGRFSKVVPDYERALIVGSLELDVAAGQIPVSGISLDQSGGVNYANQSGKETSGTVVNYVNSTNPSQGSLNIKTDTSVITSWKPLIFAEMAGQSIGVTLADIDKARVTQSFAKLRTAYAGNDATGFDNDDVIVAHLMQGLSVPAENFKRPWLLDSKVVTFGMIERFATDSANLDKSVSQGRASATLSINIPSQDVGGVVIYTVEVMPEQIHERQSDEWLLTTTVDGLPDALRDVQRPEPVDVVLNRRVDAKHTTPGGIYGYEPMNDKWSRAFTRLGGIYYQNTPGAGFNEQRSTIWMAEVVNPTYNSDHYLCPAPFPHDVFSDTLAPAFEIVARHNCSIVGLTQIGDVLAENSDDYLAVQQA